MTVYLIGQMAITDRERYNKYDAAFMQVFNQFDGTLLSVDEKPTLLEGEWTATRSVLMSFPSAESARQWFTSPAYQAIAADRLAASTGNVIMAQGMDEMNLG